MTEVAGQAAAPRSARLRVAADRVEDALRALGGVPGIERVEPGEGQPGSLSATLEGNASEGVMNDGLRVLVDAGVPVLSFELEGARLSDAFLAMTEAD